MVFQRRSILLFVDNAPCCNHAAVSSNAKLVRLPPNCSSMLQPMDQGVVWSFKCSFRKRLLEYILPLLEDEQLIMKAEVDILMAMHLVKKAWVSVHPHLPVNAFMKAGFKPTLIQPMMQPPEDKYDLIEDFIPCVY
ncbi:unnamed protein product [Echinostoma caproni]|uniref:DDE-1 domain-containing protein n=1 Tax=Echinostoma caproni TaxID=27848 RepID=A0A183B1C1_9TREM|nr:unnamed protein product [Echinostoma caproni]